MKQLEYINYVKQRVNSNSNYKYIVDYFAPLSGFIYNEDILQKLEIDRKIYLQISMLAYNILAVSFGRSTFSDSDLDISQEKKIYFLSNLKGKLNFWHLNEIVNRPSR